LDQETAVIYKCVLDRDTGVCKQGSAFIDILGRGSDRLLGHNLNLLAGILEKACFDPGDFVYVPHYGKTCVCLCVCACAYIILNDQAVYRNCVCEYLAKCNCPI